MNHLNESASPRTGSYFSNSLPVVFVVDDDELLRESLDRLIRNLGWQPKTFASAEAFLAQPRVQSPSCLVLDLILPRLNGLELQSLLGDRIELPIIFITDFVDVPMTVQAIKAGAVEVLMKPINVEALRGAIHYALDRSQNALAQEAEIRSLRNRYTSLTDRERQVMRLVVSGLLNKQVGGELGIKEITVKAHRGTMMRKMKADSVPDLVRMAASLTLTALLKDNYLTATRSLDTSLKPSAARPSPHYALGFVNSRP
jgi:FixJ family two-component response regulator